MSNFFKRPYNVNLPKLKNDEHEFAAKKGIVVCSEGGAAYFKKRWTHGLEEVKTPENKDEPVSFAVCPACQMIKNHQYEGRITVKNLPAKYEKDLEDVVRGFSKRATERDPMDRLIEIKRDPSTGSGQAANWVITTTENEMANKIAHHIKDSLRAAKSRTRFAPEPSDVAEIVIEFVGE